MTRDAGPHQTIERSWGARVGVAATLLAIALIPFLPLFFVGGFPVHHDERRYEVLTSLFADAFRHGELYPRWLPDLAGGRGYPTFMFYQPLIFYCAAAARVIPCVTVATSTYAADFFLTIIGVLGVYRLACGQLGGPHRRILAVLLALLFALMPYAFTNLYVRGDHSEFIAMILTPWPLVALQAIARRLRGDPLTLPLFANIVVGAGSLALVIYSHPAVALLYAPVLAVLVLATVFTMPRVSRARWLAAASAVAILAALVSSPYWFVVWQNADSVHLERATQGPFHPSLHAVPFEELFLSRGGLPDIDSRDRGTMTPSPLGLPQAVLAIAGVLLCLRRPRDGWVIGLALVYIAATLMMTRLAAPLWSTDTPLAFVQFPYRLLSVIAVVQIGLVIHLIASLPRRAAVFVVALSCGIAIAWHAPMLQARPTELAALPGGERRILTWDAAAEYIEAETRDLPKRNVTFSLMHEFDPIWHAQAGTIRGITPMFVADVPIEIEPSSTKYRTAASFDGGSNGGAVVIRQLYFPGWRVEIDGTAVPQETLVMHVRGDGQMVVALPPGKGRIVAYFDGPPGWRTRATVVAIVTTALIAGLWRITRRWEATQCAVRPDQVHTVQDV